MGIKKYIHVYKEMKLNLVKISVNLFPFAHPHFFSQIPPKNTSELKLIC